MTTPEELADLIELRARQIAREEIASLCGLVLRRVQDKPVGIAIGEQLVRAFADGLHDFGTTDSEPGPDRVAPK